MIQLYCCYTEAHKVLFTDYFLPSLSNNVVVRAYRLDIGGAGDFLSKEFLDTINRKVGLIIDSLERHRGEIIVWSDIDIILFKDFEEDVCDLLDENDWDMALQPEGIHTSDINSGFFAVRCNQRTIDFFHAVRDKLKAEPEKNEQPVVNELLNEKTAGVKWGKLPFEYAARSQDWPPAKKDLVLYHANCTAGKDAVQQKIDQFSDLQEYVPHKRHNVCIITPELEGPRRNSGIGTHVHYFSRYLKSLPDHEVTVFLSTESYVPCPDEDSTWEEFYYEKHGIRLVLLENQESPYEEVGWFNQWFSMRSLIVAHYLKKTNFDVCYFQDLNADGFHTLQARNTGVAFQKTAISCMINGPNLWAKQGMKQFAYSVVDDPLVNFCESYCLENCDLLTSPSRFALGWCREKEWALADETIIAPYMIDLEPPADIESKEHPPAKDVIFFGRLELRKGLMTFLHALRVIARREDARPPRCVYFLGSHTSYMDFESRQKIHEFFLHELPGFPYTVHFDLDHERALNFLREHEDALVVTPSITETLGYTIIESMMLGMNIIATNTSAIPELFEDTDRLCDPHPPALAALIEKGMAGELPPVKPRYTPGKAAESWKAVHDRCLEITRERADLTLRETSAPLVSVCVTHFNYGNYLPEQIESLAKQTYHNLEILVADDASTDPDSLRVFRELADEYGEGPFQFVEHPNLGLSENRNDLVKRAKGDYIVFCDADNISKPRMVELLVQAILNSEADCVTCHMDKFSIDPGTGEYKQLDHYTPLGACIEAGPFVDPFGDANFIIRREVFEKLGGFRTVPRTASEDWEFLAKLALEGHKLEVVPLDLFKYREHPESNMRQTTFFDTRMRVIQPYLDRMNSWQGRILYNAVGVHENFLMHIALGNIYRPDDLPEVIKGKALLEAELERKEAQIEQLRAEVRWSISRLVRNLKRLFK